MRLVEQEQHPAPIAAPELADERKSKTAAEPTVTMARSTVNIVIVGLVMFAVGLVIGLFGNDVFRQRNAEENRALIAQAVTAAISELGGAPVAEGPQLDPTQRYTIDTAGDPFIGPADAPVTIVEFGDFRCGFCARFHSDTFEPLLARYEGRIRYVFRDYPILGSESLTSAVAAECADDQGKFWEFHNLLYANQRNLTREGYLAHATTLGMDIASFTTCLDNAQHQDEIGADYQAGASLGVGGTPTFFINGRPVVGAQPLDAFVRVIDEELAQAGNS
jgi:protein-disulfide isomerase